MTHYNIQKILLWPALKFGAVIGAVLMLVPGIALGLLARSAVHILRGLVEGMGWLTQGNRDMLMFAQQITELDKLGLILVIGIALATVIIGGLLYGFGAVVAVLLYNAIAKLSGGLIIGIEALAAPAATPVPLTTSASSASAVQTGSPVPPQAAPGASGPTAQPAAPTPQAAPPAIPAVQGSVAPPVAPGAPAPSPAGPWLAGGTPPQRWPLRSDCTRLGSAPDNDVVLPGTSSHHAEIRFEDGLYVLYDMAAGQTWVNNRPVAGRNMLKEGFVIRLAGHEMTFHAS